MMGKLLPVEFHAVTVSIGGSRVSVDDGKWFFEKSFEAEAVCFQEGRVGYGGEQMDVQVVDAGFNLHEVDSLKAGRHHSCAKSHSMKIRNQLTDKQLPAAAPDTAGSMRSRK
jgi:hypothetical protein